jgi:predicted RNase H-like HicB family nuclease
MLYYTVTIWWSEDDRVFVAEAPELPGCMAHGSTQDEALKNVHAAIDLWIDVATRAGDPVPQPKRHHVDA